MDHCKILRTVTMHVLLKCVQKVEFNSAKEETSSALDSKKFPRRKTPDRIYKLLLRHGGESSVFKGDDSRGSDWL